MKGEIERLGHQLNKERTKTKAFGHSFLSFCKQINNLSAYLFRVDPPRIQVQVLLLIAQQKIDGDIIFNTHRLPVLHTGFPGWCKF